MQLQCYKLCIEPQTLSLKLSSKSRFQQYYRNELGKVDLMTNFIAYAIRIKPKIVSKPILMNIFRGIPLWVPVSTFIIRTQITHFQRYNDNIIDAAHIEREPHIYNLPAHIAFLAAHITFGAAHITFCRTHITFCRTYKTFVCIYTTLGRTYITFDVIF